MDLFVKNITQLVTVSSGGDRVKTGPAMSELGLVDDAGVLCEGGTISWVGPMKEFRKKLPDDFPELDCSGKTVLPGFVDSHTHMLFAGTREKEFALRAKGATYQEIAEAGGGIVSTVSNVRSATKKELKKQTARFLNDLLRHGTTTVEIKSGYGLDLDTEVKMLEAINELGKEELMSVIPTFIGAHAIPAEYRQNLAGYVDLVINTMIPYVGRKKLAAFCDVFCEEGYFGPEETARILREGKKWGMEPKIHADELTPLGGAEVAAEVGAVSADHLERAGDKGIAALARAGVVAGLLPGVSFFLNHGYAPARKLIDAGVPVAIASDFNPGSCMSYSMPMMMTIACTQMKMTPEEAITAATLNGAAALSLSSSAGSIEPGKSADLIVAEMKDYRMLAYHFGVNHITKTIKQGVLLEV
ncbi:MAG: imidazolonepropionase [Ignavibacteria bacterium]|nr:imidazolonepropionase [Ignavibacteria bacterium]